MLLQLLLLVLNISLARHALSLYNPSRLTTMISRNGDPSRIEIMHMVDLVPGLLADIIRASLD